MRYIALAALVMSAALAASPSLAQDGYTEVESPGAAKHQDRAFRTDQIVATLAPANDPSGGDAVEHMVEMKAGDTLIYNLEAPAGTELWHEFHGHVDKTVSFYKKADGAKHSGSLTAPFHGAHGWYLKNKGAAPVTVRIALSGFYDLETPPAE